MNETESPRRIGRRIGALFAGLVFVVAVSLGTDLALHAAGIIPELGQRMSNALFALATVYRTVYSVAGSYLTARLAPDRPMGHALVGGLIGVALEQGSRTALVSRCPHRHRDAYRMAGRQAPLDAIGLQPTLIEYHCLVSVG